MSANSSCWIGQELEAITKTDLDSNQGGAVTGKKLAGDIDLPLLLESCRHARQAAVVTHGPERFHIEPLACRDRLMRFGAGHVLHSVARLACRVGFGITVVDDRPEFANRAEKSASSDRRPVWLPRCKVQRP